MQHRTTPAAVHRNLLGPFQRSLLGEGVPLAWIVDVGVRHPSFGAVQSLFMAGKLDIGLSFDPDGRLSATDWRAWGGHGAPPETRGRGAERLMQ